MAIALADAALTHHDVAHVNAHGTSTLPGDAVEADAIHAVLPDGPLVTSTKGVLGHSLGATGAVEAALTVLSVQHSVVPPTANLDSPDATFDLNFVTTTAANQRIDVALSHSFGFGGHNVVLAFRAARPLPHRRNGSSAAGALTSAIAAVTIACPRALDTASPWLVGTERGAQLGVLIGEPEVGARRRVIAEGV